MPTPEITQKFVDSPLKELVIKPTNLGNGWTSRKIDVRTDDYKTFVLFTPKDWNVVVEVNKDTPTDYLNVTLTKGGFKAVINQSERGYGTCKFSEDNLNTDGMVYLYSDYVKVKTAPEWRFAKRTSQSNETQYTVCQNRKYLSEMRFMEVTSIGGIFVEDNTNDQTVVKEFVEILKRIEIH